MIFRQLFDPISSTYTYLIGHPGHGRAVLVDPVLETHERDLALLNDLGLALAATIETHIHADHLTSALKLKSLTGSRIVIPAGTGAGCADAELSEEHPYEVDGLSLRPLFTPGHTDHHLSYRLDGGAWQAVLSGDALLIDGCGRTDFQGGDSRTLYRSVRDRLFTLPDETLVYPGHDYQGRRVSSIGQEKDRNPRLGGERTAKEFARIMADLDLPYPKKIDLAVPGNLDCGRCPDNVPRDMERLCDPSVQG